MTPHPDSETLQLFARCELGENLAVHVAEHLDACPSCAAQVVALDPLQRLMRTQVEPELPDGLVEAILHDARQPQHVSAIQSDLEVLIGIGMLTAAAIAMMLSADFGVYMTQLSTIVAALQLGLSHLPSGGIVPLALSLTMGVWAMVRLPTTMFPSEEPDVP